jgi:hypothetical protein
MVMGMEKQDEKDVLESYFYISLAKVIFYLYFIHSLNKKESMEK